MERLEELKYSADLAKKLRADGGGLSLAEAAKTAGISKSTWQQYEQQKRPIDAEIIKRFCKNVGLNPDEYVKTAQDGLRKAGKAVTEGPAPKPPGNTKITAPATSDLKQYRKALGWTLDDAEEYLGISRKTLVRIESDKEDEGERVDRVRGDKVRAQYHGIFIRTAKQAKDLVSQHIAGNGCDFISDVGGLLVVPIFETTETLQAFFPQLKGTGETASYYRYVAWQVFAQLLELGKSARLYEFADESLKDSAFKKDLNISSLRAFLSLLSWS